MATGPNRGPPPLLGIVIVQPLDQPRPEIPELHRPLQDPKRIALLAKVFEMVMQAEERTRVGDEARSSIDN